MEDRSTQPMNVLHPPAAGPVLAWAVLSLAGLFILAFRVPLWARVAAPGEQFALVGATTLQIGLLCLLFPWILTSQKGSLTVAAGTGLLIQLSGLLADAPMWQTWLAAGALWVAVVALFLSLRVLHPQRLRHLAVAVLSLVIIGGAILGYLRAEFSGF